MMGMKMFSTFSKSGIARVRKLFEKELGISVPARESRKGENGVLTIIGGSKEYHGAPVFSILAARRFVDLVYYFPPERSVRLDVAISSIPEAIVVDKRNASKIVEKSDAVLFGIGLGSAKVPRRLLYSARKLIIDGDGLKYLKADLLNSRSKLPKDVMITPHEGEFRMLFGKEGSVENVKKIAKELNLVIVKKGRPDIVSDGKVAYLNDIHNEGMTKGGTGDVLSGLASALSTRNSLLNSGIAACVLCGLAANMLLEKHSYFFSASDLANELSSAARFILPYR